MTYCLALKSILAKHMEFHTFPQLTLREAYPKFITAKISALMGFRPSLPFRESPFHVASVKSNNYCRLILHFARMRKV